jgi:large subunit ribosomal protein L33
MRAPFISPGVRMPPDAGAGEAGTGQQCTLNGNDNHFQNSDGCGLACRHSRDPEGTLQPMARNELRPIIKLRSTAGTGYTYVTRKNRRNNPDRLTLRKYDPIVRRHVEFREER